MSGELIDIDLIIAVLIGTKIRDAGVSHNSVANAIGMDKGQFSKKIRGVAPFRLRDVHMIGNHLGIGGAGLLAEAEALLKR